MLLYIASENHINLCDFLEDEYGIIVKKLIGAFDFKQFVLGDLKNLNHIQYIAIDYNALKDTEEELLYAIDAYKKLYTSRLVFYFDKLDDNIEIALKIVEKEMYNIVEGLDDIDLIRQDFLKAVLKEGKLKSDITKRLKPEPESKTEPHCKFKDENIRIAVTGVERRVGTTTLAINFANYLAGIGAKVAYLEANSHNHLEGILEYKEKISGENENVKYVSAQMQTAEKFDFVIYDMGVIDERIIRGCKNCEATLLCGTNKPWELQTEIQKKNLENEGIFVHTFLSLVPENRQEEFAQSETYYVKMIENMFESNTNKAMWNEIITPYINEKN